MTSFTATCFAAAAITLASAMFMGAPAGADEKAAASGPELMTATYGDWLLRCQQSKGAAKQCEAATVITPQGQTSPVAQLVVAPGAKDGWQIAVLLPDNVTFAPAPRLVAGTPAQDIVSFSWVSCTPAACLAAAPLTAEAQTAMQALKEPGRIVFHDSTGREINVVISFKGFTQAANALSQP